MPSTTTSEHRAESRSRDPRGHIWRLGEDRVSRVCEQCDHAQFRVDLLGAVDAMNLSLAARTRVPPLRSWWDPAAPDRCGAP